MRVLITGTREKDYPPTWIIADLLRLAHHCWQRGEKLTLVHGDCPTGVDRYVRIFVENLPEQVRRGNLGQEPYPADWSMGRGAGPVRNQKMVDLGADLCLAYPRGVSKGTRGCARLAGLAGIPTLATEYGYAQSQTLEHRLRQAGIMLLEGK